MTTTATQKYPAQPQEQKPQGYTAYIVGGQEVKLSYDIVRQYLTKGNGAVTDQEIVQFISICKFNQLNPFLNEAYLVKFQGQAENAQMIVSKEALMKRAEANSEYDGFKAGLIVERDGAIEETEGSFTLKGDIILGGWAEVYRKDRKFPIVSKLSLEEYDKGQSTWKSKKCTMIRKTAIVQAMREAFPTQLGAMYTAEEKGLPEDVSFEDLSKQPNAPIAFEEDKEPQPIQGAEPQKEDCPFS